MKTYYILKRERTKYSGRWQWFVIAAVLIMFILGVDNTRTYKESTEYDWAKIGERYRRIKVAENIRSMILYLKPDVSHLDEIVDGVILAEEMFNTPHDKMVALMFVESSFRPGVISSADCIGLTQPNPAVHRWIERERLFEIEYNILAGARILRGYRDMSSCWEEAFIRYNGWVPGSTFGQWVLEVTDEVRNHKKRGRS